MKYARQERVGNEVRQRALKNLENNLCLAGYCFIYFFFYFSVALVVRGEKSPQLRAFSRQPARQRDSNGVCNGL